VNTWRVILATLVIFGAGVVAGGLLVKNLKQHPSNPPLVTGQSPAVPTVRIGQDGRMPERLDAPPVPRGLRKDFIKNLDCELKLSTDQRERIEKILCEGQECTKKLWDEVAPQVRAEWKRVKEAIRAELSEDQKTKFDQFMKRSHKPADGKAPQPAPTPTEPPQ
jgi:hypothetical protein